MPDMDWGKLLQFSGVVSLIVSFGWMVAQSIIGNKFVTKADFGALGDRLSGIEVRLAGLPTHDEEAALSQRVAAVERGVAVVQAEVTGLRESTSLIGEVLREGQKRIEHQLGIVNSHLLSATKP